jgi:hypothetical protein
VNGVLAAIRKPIPGAKTSQSQKVEVEIREIIAPDNTGNSLTMASIIH